ncbi:predicted protein [Naegleria gruberi]|uniref:Predicted protein n=1 Tax=Naegleria gruberi TaxID=5762 RepID=D2V6S0_NAEGR|nr:uncharacterized protein NAEGRDRAFT_64538 [Naegleria gruberi]EFC47490.1 predicted protein [Naegleria gruberi]|eukprot:XP_002680234.1 predicted protein [Naegleria gruberi strain NEG-M]
MGQSQGSLPPEFEQSLGRVLHFDDQLLMETCPNVEQQFDILHDIVLSLYDHSQFKHFIQTRIDALVLKHLGRILCFLVNIHKELMEQEQQILYKKQTSLTLEIEKVIICIYEMAVHFLSNPFLYQSLALNLLQGEKNSQEKEQVYSYYIDPGFYFLSKANIIEQVLRFLKELTIGGPSRHLFLEPQTPTTDVNGQQDQKITEQRKQDFIGSIMEIQQQFALKSRG